MENQKKKTVYSVAGSRWAPTVSHAPSLTESRLSFQRRLDRQLADRVCVEVDEMYAEAYVSICPANDMALFAMVDAVEKIKEAGLCKQGVKHHIKRALKAKADYEAALQATLERTGTMQYFMDLSDEFYEEMRPLMLRFRMAIKNYLDRRHEPLSEAKSYHLWAHSMLYASVMQWDAYWENRLRRASVDVDPSRNFRAARLQGILSAWDAAGACMRWENTGVIYEDPDVDRGMKSVLMQINNSDRINRAGNKALSLNPDRKEMSEKREKERKEREKETTIW